MKARELYSIARQAVAAWADDYAPSMGAALAYYTLFSIAPLLLIVVSVAGLVFGEDAARGQVVAELRDFMGEAGATAIQGLLQSVNKPAQGVFATVVGVGTLLIGAMTVFGELQDALDRIWRAPARARASGLWALVRTRLLSFGMVLGLGFLLIVSLVASAAVGAVSKYTVAGFAWWPVVVEVLNFLLSFALVTVTFAMIYKIIPRVRIAWRDVWIGAVATALLFSIGKFLIGLYIGAAASPPASARPARWSSSCSGCTTRLRSSCSAPNSRGSTRTCTARVGLRRRPLRRRRFQRGRPRRSSRTSRIPWRVRAPRSRRHCTALAISAEMQRTARAATLQVGECSRSFSRCTLPDGPRGRLVTKRITFGTL
jgi:membrane protein